MSVNASNAGCQHHNTHGGVSQPNTVGNADAILFRQVQVQNYYIRLADRKFLVQLLPITHTTNGKPSIDQMVFQCLQQRDIVFNQDNAVVVLRHTNRLLKVNYKLLNMHLKYQVFSDSLMPIQ